MRVGRHGLRALCLQATLVSMLGASVPAMAQTPDEWTKVTAAAKAEGKVIVYSAYVGAPSSRNVAKAFEAKFGIPVELLEVRGSEIRERVRVEQAAGRTVADVLYSTIGQVKLQETEEKTVVALSPMPNVARLLPEHKADTAFAPTMVIPYGILINTGLVKPADEPKTWADLADTKWKGKILADDPRAIGGGYATFVAMHDKIGVPYLEKLSGNNLVMTRDQRESQRRTARGEFAVYIPFILTDVPSLKGLPVKHIIPTEGVAYALYGNAPVKGAPHPSAARLYIDFCLSEEAQLLYAREGHGFTTSGVAEKVPAEIVVSESNDPRSYRLSSDKLLATGFERRFSVTNAIDDVVARFKAGDIEDKDECYTVRWMKHLNLTA